MSTTLTPDELIAALEARLQSSQSARATDDGQKILRLLRQRQRQLTWAMTDANKWLARPDEAYRAIPEAVTAWIAARIELGGRCYPAKIRKMFAAETGLPSKRGDFYYGLLNLGATEFETGELTCRLK